MLNRWTGTRCPPSTMVRSVLGAADVVEAMVRQAAEVLARVGPSR